MSKDKELSNLNVNQDYNLEEIQTFDYDVDVVDNDLIVRQSNSVSRNAGRFKGQTGTQVDDINIDVDGNLIQELNTNLDQNLGKIRLDKNIELTYNKSSTYGMYNGENSVILENWFNLQYTDIGRYTIDTVEYRYIIPIVSWQGTTLSQTTISTAHGLNISANSISSGFNLAGIVDRNDATLNFQWNSENVSEKYVLIELPQIQYINSYSFKNFSVDHAIYSLEIYASLNGIDYTKIDEILDIDVTGVLDTYNRVLNQQETVRYIKLVPLSVVGNGGIGSFNIFTINEPYVNYQLQYSPFIFDSTYFEVVETPTELQISTKEANDQIDTKLLTWENYVKLEHRRVLENITTAAGVTVRNLNAVTVNNLNITTSLPNFILPAGMYFIRGQAQTYLTNYYGISLRDLSNNIYLMGTYVYNGSTQSTNGSCSHSFMSGIVQLNVDTTMRVMQYAQTASSTGASQGGIVIDTSNPDFNYAVIADLEIWKIADNSELTETALDPHWNSVVLLMNGDQIEDNSKYKYPLTRISGTVTDNTTIGTGGFGNGYQTPRIKSYPTVNHNLGNGDFTIELNYYLSSTPVNSVLCSDDSHPSLGSFALYLSNSTTMLLVIGTGTGNNLIVITYTSNNFLNQWNSVALVRSGSTFNLFFNGLLVQTGNSALTLNNNRLFIGDSINVNTAFPGTISNIRVTKGVARYSADYTPPSSIFTKDTP